MSGGGGTELSRSHGTCDYVALQGIFTAKDCDLKCAASAYIYHTPAARRFSQPMSSVQNPRQDCGKYFMGIRQAYRI